MTKTWELFESLEILADINFLKNYLDDIERLIEVEQDKVVQRYRTLVDERWKRIKKDEKQRGKKIDEDDIYFYITEDEKYYAGQEERFYYYANILRESFFLTLYALFESRLNQECRRRQNEMSLSLDDIKGATTERAKIYWEKVLGFSFPNNSYWGDIHVGYRLLRNCIVHNEGLLNQNFTEFKKLKNFIDRKQSPICLSGEKIVLSKDFCKEAIKTIEKFFDSLHKSIL